MHNEILIKFENHDGGLAGFIEDEKISPLISSTADTEEEFIANFRMLLKDFQEHEYKNDPYLGNLNIDEVVFKLERMGPEYYED